MSVAVEGGSEGGRWRGAPGSGAAQTETASRGDAQKHGTERPGRR